jgi:hypothetical protein
MQKCDITALIERDPSRKKNLLKIVWHPRLSGKLMSLETLGTNWTLHYDSRLDLT